MREFSVKIKMREKAMVFISFALLFLLLFIPLWQIGVNHSLEMKIMESEYSLSELEEEERRIRLSFAEREAFLSEEAVLSSIDERMRESNNF